MSEKPAQYDVAPPKPPKLTRSQKRYEAFLSAGSELRFGEWLKLRPAP